jgi:4-amino-4-deoxy-L-arabinose transferase-like glycosyltransferase
MLVLALTIVRLLVIGLQPFSLYGDEAQYWVWAQHLAWGYYSKPPLVAWIIAATTGLAGDTEMGVRLAAPMLHAVTALVIGALGRDLYGPRTGAAATALYACLPGVGLSSIVISTDVPLLLCWAVALLALVRARATGQVGWWLLLGAALGVGMLAKYAMGYFLLSLACFIAWSPDRRALLRDSRLWGALALGLLIYFPNLAWNLAHGMASYRHVAENAEGEGFPFHPLKLLEFLGGQFGVVGPVVLVAMALGLLWPGRLAGDDRFRLLAAFTLPNLAIIAVVALLSHGNANWAAASYVAGTVLAAAWLVEDGRRRLLQAALAVNLLATAGIYLFHPVIDRLGVPLTLDTDPFVDLRGWSSVGRAVGEVAAYHPDAVLVTSDRMLYAELAFYIRPPRRQLAWNPDGRVENQFEMEADLGLLKRAPLLYVTAEPDPAWLRQRFASVEKISTVTVPLYRDFARRYGIYALAGYKG